MIGLIARLKVKPGSETAAAEICRRLAKEVQEKEQDCLFYEPFAAADNPAEIVFLEKYTSQEALEYHRGTAHYIEASGKIRELLQEPPEIILLKGFE